MRARSYAGAVVIVTGAASGIGAALVHALQARGAHVVATDVNPTGLAALHGVRTVVLDVTDAAAVTQLINDVATEHGRLDVMFNNAGVVAGGDFDLTDDHVWRKVVDVNLWGVVHGSRAAYTIMRTQGFGHIVNTSSSAGVMPVAQSVAYAATKHAVVGLSTSLRAEGARHGVRVSAVIPGVVDTAIFGSAANVGTYNYNKAMDRVPFAKISPAVAAEHILDGASRNRQLIVFPLYNRVLVTLYRLLPGMMSRVINR